MRTKHYLHTIILLFINPFILFGQNENLRLATIPIELIKNNRHILIKAKVNNEKALTFYFDTGASWSVLDKESAQNLDIAPNYEQEVEGAGGKLKYQIALNQKINIKNIEVDSIDLVLEDLSRLKKQLGHNFDGIIGYSLLKNYITEINIDEEAIFLYPRNEKKLDLSDYTSHSFSFDRDINIPQLDIEIELKTGEKMKGKVFFDSGAGLTLLINTPFKIQNKLVEKSEKILTTFTENLSKRSKSQEIALKSLTFAGYTFHNVPIGLTSDNAGVSSFDGYLGILGAEIINKFNIILDYDAQKMYLKPSKIYDKKFSIPLTGFSLEKAENKIIISEISPESPAYKKGVREGDELITINGRKDFTLKESNELLKKDGKRVKLTLKNKSGIKTYRIKLKKLL